MTVVDDADVVDTAAELDARLEVLPVLLLTEVLEVEDDDAEVMESTEEVVDLVDDKEVLVGVTLELELIDCVLDLDALLVPLHWPGADPQI